MKLALCAAWLAVASACTSGDRRLEPDELDARDLLGVSPRVAAGWDAGQRAGARAVLWEAWREGEAAASLPGEVRDAPSAARLLSALDAEREADGEPPMVAAAAVAGARSVRLAGLPVVEDPAPAAAGSLVAVDWRDEELELVARGGDLLVEVARRGGHDVAADLPVHPARGRPFGAVYLGPELGLLVNPVLLAALEPAAGAAVVAVARPVEAAAREQAPAPGPREAGSRPVASDGVGGNPYSFFGSVEECAAYQRLRCEECLPSASCEQTARGVADGDAECTRLGEDGGRGYFLYCANLSLAIETVSICAEDEAPSCAQVTSASNDIAQLEANAVFLDDATCLAGLDACLAEIYGDPDQEFPGPVGSDAGPAPAPPEPRETETSCSGSDVNCEFSPQCDADCSSSCDDAFSCDADCNGSGSSGGCDSCGGGGDSGTSGGDSGCGCDDDSGGGAGGGGGGDGGGGCGGGGDSGGGDSGCGGGGCGDGGGCGGGDGGGCGGGGDGCNGGGGGGGGGGCVVSGRPPAAAAGRCRRSGGAAGLLALFWALAPLPYLERCRRRARRREAERARAAGGEP